MNLISKAVSFARAELSGSVPNDLYAARLTVCQECPRLIRRGAHMYCGACGCGTWRFAELHYKLRLRLSFCPLNKWGFRLPGPQGPLARDCGPHALTAQEKDNNFRSINLTR
jgi:hypothetical protein